MMLRGASRSFLSNLALFITVTLFTSSCALSVDWTANKHPTHTLDSVTAILSGGSGDPSSVNVALVVFNKDTGEEHSVSISNNVASTGRYSAQIPNQYVGDPGSKAMKDYFSRTLRYKTRASNPSNGQTLGESDDFVVYWNPDDGTPTPTQFSTSSSSGGGGGGGSNSGSGGGGGGNSGGGDSGNNGGSSANDNSGNSPTATKNGDSNPDGSPASQGSSGASPSGSTATSISGNQVLSTTATAFGEKYSIDSILCHLSLFDLIYLAKPILFSPQVPLGLSLSVQRQL
ncbi:hypothetical protein DL96DRAFT_118262 [Flagelloscypha sp. PMI_526]|nr:hypothetical protein DL96DRAFT_118262 [Flagelloscypha sp. PMI_526]